MQKQIKTQNQMQQKRVQNSAELEQAAKETTKLREAKIVLAIGEKGVGKTFETMRFFNEEYCVSSRTKLGKKVLIYDTNGEFEDVDPISLYDIPKFNIQKVIEIRRVLARHPDTFEHLGVNGKTMLLEQILTEKNAPRGMALLLEDLNSYVMGATSQSIVDFLTTNRHKELDIFIHMQTFRAVPPRIWGNVNLVRLHQTGDDVSQVLNKVRNRRLTSVANILTQQKCKKDKRFFCYIDYDDNTVSGDFTYQDIFDACHMFFFSSNAEKNNQKMLYSRDKRITIEAYVKELVKEFTDK
jgi:hypothetical protein